MTRPANDPDATTGSLHFEPETEDVTVIRLEGEFDLSNASQIWEDGERLLREGNDLILDLSSVLFIDSHVVASLFSLAHYAPTQGRVAVLELGTATIVDTVIRLSGVDLVLRRTGSRRDSFRVIRDSRRDEPSTPSRRTQASLAPTA